MKVSARGLLPGALAMLVACTVVPAGSTPPPPGVRNPRVTGPLGTTGLHGFPWNGSVVDLGRYGYREAEFLISGSATNFGWTSATNSLPGQTNVQPTATQQRSEPYTTRIIVRYPTDPRRFNGTAVVEWDNVTSRNPTSPDWIWTYQEILREGYAFVGVVSQKTGTDDVAALSLRNWDPVRYAAVSHPGDDYSFDVFAQAVQAVRHPRGIAPLGGLRVRRVVAMGQSQGANRLYTYANLVQARTSVVDGFLLDAGDETLQVRRPSAPVIRISGEGEATSNAPLQGPLLRVWQVAGAAHLDAWEMAYGYQQQPHDELFVPYSWDEETAGQYGERPMLPGATGNCQVPGNQFPRRYVVSAALHHLDRWARSAGPPPTAPRLTFDAAGGLRRDRFGNALGGLRLPVVTVPVATYNGTDCDVFGSTKSFDTATLSALYPTGRAYVERMRAATAGAVRGGYLRAADARDLMARATRAPLSSTGA